MFRAIACPCTTFEGYQVALFQQGRCNLAERTLTRSVIHFAPQLGKVGIFLATALDAFSEEALRAAWIAQGSPRPLRRDPNVPLLFGKPLKMEVLPFAGCDDLWESEEGTLHVACKRMPDFARLAPKLTEYTHTQLLRRANELLEGLIARGARRPAKLCIKPLRTRILGQCTRDGEIRLNPILLQWHDAILEETLAHELIHLRHFNHSPAFWRELSALLPDWLPRSLVHYL